MAEYLTIGRERLMEQMAPLWNRDHPRHAAAVQETKALRLRHRKPKARAKPLPTHGTKALSQTQAGSCPVSAACWNSDQDCTPHELAIKKIWQRQQALHDQLAFVRGQQNFRTKMLDCGLLPDVGWGASLAQEAGELETEIVRLTKVFNAVMADAMGY